jgi:dihydroorotate dehydrogenase electron transfer subunit
VRLLIGTDSEQTAVIRTASKMHHSEPSTPLLVLIGSADSFSFKPRPSTILVPGMLPGVIAAVPSLEEFGIASRLASELGLPGCYDGTVLELAEQWLRTIEPSLHAGIEIKVAGPEELLRSAEELGRRRGLPVSLSPTNEP